MEKVSFITEDGVKIFGDFYEAEGDRAILLLHMMPSTKESWQGFAEQLIENNWSALAIDLRGHGESIKNMETGETLDYKQFSDPEHQASYYDIAAAKEWLDGKGLFMSIIGGASIGANLAVWWQSEHTDVQKTVLLSPGFNYRGLEARPYARELEDPQGFFVAGGTQDERSDGSTCGQVAREVYEMSEVNDKEKRVLETEKHGTDLFQFEPNLQSEIIEWLSS